MSDGRAVLLVDSGKEWRGGQQQAYLIARQLTATGEREVHLVAPPGSPLAERAAGLGIHVSEFRGSNDLDLRAASKLAAVAKHLKPAVIHCNDSRAHSLAFLARKLGARCSMVVSRRILRIPGRGSKYRSADRFAAVSRAVAHNLNTAGVPPEKVDVVYSGVDRPDPAETAVRPVDPNTRFMIATVAALEHAKGLDTLVAAAASPLLANVSIEWVVVGAGPERKRLERLQQKLRAPVRFMGWYENVAGILRGADLVAHPSRSEALGTAIIEALWRGKPVVASDVGGIPELVDESVGSLVPVDDPEALGGAVLKWLKDPSRRATVGETGPRRASRFGVEEMSAGMLRCYSRATTESVS